MQKMKKLLSVLLCLAMLLSNVPMAFAAGETYEKVTSETEFTTGSYVMVVDTGYAMGALDGTWITAAQPRIGGDTVVDAAGAVWTLTVDGSTVKITDANGVSIKPKAANTNGIASGDFSWSWAFENGTFTFTAEAETVRLASNAQANQDWTNKFRAYKLTTLSGSYAADYHSNFELYKLKDGGTVEPPVTEPVVTEPVVTEPVETKPVDPDGTELSVEKAIAMGVAMEHNTYTDTKYNVTGVITEVYNTQYGNMKIADEAGNILTIYGTWSADGATRYDALEVQPVAGDTVTIYGPVGQYSGAAQIKNGWIVKHIPASTEPQPSEPSVEPTEPSVEPTQPSAPATGTYEKVTSAAEFTTGSYVMMVDTGYAMGALDGTWISFVQPKVSGDAVVDAAGGVWTLTVDGSTVKITDANGVSLKPKAANTNGIASGDFGWSWAFENGTFTFTAEAEAVRLASNAASGQDYTNKFRAYKLTTLSGSYAADYHSNFELYKLADGTTPVPPVTEPSEPEVTEPSVEPTTPAAPTELTIEQAIAMGAAMEHNVYTTEKYQVTGVITEVYNTQYGNMRISDDKGNILTVYGTYGADGTVRYDALEVKPVAGDTVTIYGIVGQYNGVPQIKNGWIVAHTASTVPQPTEPEIEEPADGTALTIEEALTLGASKDHNVYTANKYNVTGVITEVYNTQYGNMKIADEAGNILTVYGTYNADGTVRYDALEVQPVAGDTVTVYGPLGQYNGVPQIKNGWIVKHIPASTEPQPSEPVVTEPTAPSVEPTAPSEPEVTEPTAPVIPEGSTVINVTVDAAEIHRGDTATVIVSIAGENVWSSMGYIPFTNSEYFTVLDGSVVISGAGLAEFTVDGGGVVMLNSASAATGDVFRFTVKIADNAPFGTFQLTDVASMRNGMADVPVFVLETGAKVQCRHEVTFDSLGQEKHSGVCTICGETVTEEHNYVEGKCDKCNEYKDYVVTFQYEDGTVISQATYHYGDAVVVPETPAVPNALADTHEFDGWDQEIVAVTGDATYTAQFKLKYIRGDVNNDQEVNDADAMYLLRYTLFADRYPINQPGDMNGDGEVNDADAMYLLRHTLFADRYPLAKG